MLYPVLLIVFFGLMLVYFRIADRYNIIDKPNERSSHTEVTIRGGGVIFPISCLLAACFYPQYLLPAIGAVAIGTISFIDDRITLSSKIRLVVHFFSVTLMFIALNAFALPLPWVVTLYIFAIGVINVYNFMDGINGITGAYTLVVLAGLQYVNLYVVSFVEPDLIWFPMLASVAFLYFNFRKKAKCFAGDVGSITIAFWIVFLLARLIIKTQDLTYILFLAVYGIDSVLTIIHRLILKQNIFKAHRLHFYQLLANERRIPHLMVSSLYAIVQIAIIAFVITCDQLSPAGKFAVVLLPLVILYIVIKSRLMLAVKKVQSV
ncbi:glycosyltransferase family 4 protein [Mucilaginibacter conchicola]|uniref:Glycosyltransferase family 4 protein n=1 Tax=Mucilaginibacter conchicola TaxID=2303333 RepID=A0A372P0D5_9SPHI|nr:glycosyltransferase family 4 protein [Mucilaginibacter conchicola]